ncbi:TfoX/Sxy family protein [Sphingobium phenoxybenzoativorans]|uniref:TfoX/Sxy family protein n=1 Tax=Sphingobium phenoxybenzoativorans TaxID=1592790 RepID=A0A975Q257_9SPHN|nr:TfoX/Sxy family protein [Sphingobium phenoxybenzoativorans]QUT06655.1 TfoX/Sxy family protein [Sphingobium phenoxybenzoativorans]
MSIDEGLIDWISEALEPMGTVTMRRMMGGATLYLNGTIFAIMDSGTFGGALWMKADKESEAIWEAAGCRAFTYERKDGKMSSMPYRLAPDEVYDDADEMRRWAALAVEAGLRAPAKKAKAGKKAQTRTPTTRSG